MARRFDDNLRNSASDAGRKGAVSDYDDRGPQMTPQSPKGRWLPAYTGGMGRTSRQIDPYDGSALDEVGNDADGR